MARPKAVVFDFGGVLTDNYSEINYHLEISEKFGVPVDVLMPYLKANRFLSKLILGEVSEREVVQRVMAEFPSAVDLNPRAINSDNFIPSKDALGAVREFKARTGVMVAIGTNLFPSSREILREEAGLEELFEKTYYSFELGMRKPEVDFFDHIATDLGFERPGILLLDDVRANVDAAIDAGFNGVHITGSSAQTIELLGSIE